MTEVLEDATVIGSVMVIGVVTCYALLHSICNLKSTQRNIQCSQILELMLYKFELGHNFMEATKNICCIKSDHSTVKRWIKKFC